MSDLIRRQTEHEFTLHDAATVLAAPSGATAGGALPTMTDKPRDWALSIDFGTTGASLTNGVLCAYDATDAKWRAIATLHQGLAITDDGGVGWEDTFRDLAAAGTRFAVKGAISAGTVTIKLRPLGVAHR